MPFPPTIQWLCTLAVLSLDFGFISAAAAINFPDHILQITMKRIRNSEAGEVSHVLIQYSGPSFSDLPRDILVNILLRLTIKGIFVCKSVCKIWYDLISDPEFAKLHFEQAQVCPLIRTSGTTFQSRLLYLVEPDQDDFEVRLGMCDYTCSKPECLCQVKVKLDTKLKLPLRNLQMIFDDKDSGYDILDPDRGTKCFKLKMKNHKYRIVNSCNGLLCLSHPLDNDPLIACNPVTGEFIELPEAKKVDLRKDIFRCGFGFSPVTNQYKVIRMFKRWTRDANRNRYIYGGIGADVHILGTESWKDIGIFSQTTCNLFPTYLNGFLYWSSDSQPLSIISFDIEKECFGSVSAPPLDNSKLDKDVTVGVLEEELCISCVFGGGDIQFWVMKHYGEEEEWSKVFSINLWTHEGLAYGQYQPIKYLNDGAVLVFHYCENALLYKDPRKPGFRYLKVRGTRAELEAFAHIPSFVSLKDTLSGLNVKVLNIKSRCAELKLHNEAKSISVVEEEGASDTWVY